MRKILLLILAAAFGVSMVFSQSYVDGEWTYTLNERNEAAITSYSGAGGAVVLPSIVDGYPVMAVGVDWSPIFGSNNTSVTSVTIPDSVTRIGAYAFINCTSLASVTIGKSVTSVGYGAFINCTSLTSVTIPDSVTSIGAYAFLGCTSLTSITIPDSVTSIGYGVFWGSTSLTSVIIPHGVTSIEAAFYGCTSLTSVTIPDSVTSIGEYAFINCTSLASVTIPDSVTSIGEFAFWGCTSMTSVTIPDSVTSVEYYAFFRCSGLISVIIGRSVTNIGGLAFSLCGNLVELSVSPNNLHYTSIEGVLFDKNATQIKVFPGGRSGHYTMPATVNSIGDYAFYECTGLTSITMPDSVTSIGRSSFKGCANLTSFFFRGSAPTLEDTEFVNLSEGIVAYYLPSSSGWGSTLANLPTQPFIPTAQEPSLAPSSGFQFSWTGTGLIPMNVRRATSPGGPWTVVSTNISAGQFTDFNPPSGKAFYQAYLP